MTAEVSVTRLRHGFEYDWELLRAAGSDPLDDAHVQAALALARTLVVAVDDLVAAETSSWTAEFRSSLEQAEQALREGPR